MRAQVAEAQAAAVNRSLLVRRGVRWLIVAVAVTMIPSAAVSRAATSEQKGRVTLAFGGDVNLERRSVAQGFPGGFSTLPDLLGGADIAMINLETAITTRGTPERKMYQFRTHPRVLESLFQSGVDVVSMANNHSMDFGRDDGLADTLRARAKSKLAVIGIGENLADAISPYRKTINNTAVSIFAVAAMGMPGSTSNTWPAKKDRSGMVLWQQHRSAVLSAVKKESKTADVIVVFMHWGDEYAVCPNGTQKSIADELFLAGADVIVGAHPHILQGTSLSNNKLIAYSLGNFSWYANYSLSGALLTVKIDDGKVTGYSMTPTIWDRYGLPMRATGSRKSQIETLIKTANACGGLKRNT